jgi:hypothetical protein
LTTILYCGAVDFTPDGKIAIVFQAHLELKDRHLEHETVKMIRLKSGLLKWSNAHKEMAAKYKSYNNFIFLSLIIQWGREY